MKKYLLITFLCINIFVNVSAQFDERFYYPTKDYKKIENINYEEIFFNIDTVKLHCLFLKPDKIANTTIIFFIGSSGNVSYYTSITKPLANAGYQVIMFDPRGYGKSTGIPTHINIASDAQIILDSILKKEEIKDTRIIVYGVSMGTQVATKIAKDNQDKIHALILDGPMSSFTDIALASAPAEQKQVISQYVTSPYSAKEDIKEIKNMPKLIIHSKEDESIPFEQGELVYKNANQPKNMWIYKGKHLESIIKNEELFIQKINALTSSLSDTLYIEKNYKLNISINGLKNNNGQVVLQLNDTLESEIKSITGNIYNNQCNILIDDIVAGKYTILYFHDENKNNELDANIIGIPKEGYGFSNNASGKYGPPPIVERIFDMSEDKSMVLKPFYW